MPHSLRTIGIILILCAVFISPALAQDPPHWTYEGEEGPEHWGELSPEYTACIDGTAQSPIDISNALEADLTNIEISYGETPLAIFNNGHTIQVNASEGSSITYNEITYNLLQFHFHHPSEHTVNGEQAAMEIHFVNKEPVSGNLAVIGVLLMAGDDDNAAYAPLFDNLPAEKSEPLADGPMLDVMSLLPEKATYYTYQGSLTTPPCSQIVRWLLLDTPVSLSAAQIEAFGAIFENNARPVQERNSRDLLLDTSE